MIKAENIEKTFNLRSKYPTKAIDNISFEIKSDEVTGLIGPNGAGKTTLIRIILGFETPNSGKISILNKSNNDIEVKKLIGYQSDLPYMSKAVKVADFLELNSALLGYENNQNQISELLDYFQMKQSINKKLSELSKGMRQKVEIINAFLGNPKLIILDEPTAALDPVAVIELRDFINQKKKTGITILFSSHHLTEVENICDRALFISNGRLTNDFDVRNQEQGFLEEAFRKYVMESRAK